jgi:hypothetical protein
MRDEVYIENDNVEDTWTTECQGSSCAVSIIGVDGRVLPHVQSSYAYRVMTQEV